MRQVPLHELPLYIRENSLVVLGPERSHVGERPADPLTVEAFVTTEARFTVRGEPGRLELRCRRNGRRTTFEASEALVTYELRLRDHAAPGTVTADGQALPRLDPAALAGADRGWTVDGRTVVAKATSGAHG